jgi:hypothetical protein
MTQIVLPTATDATFEIPGTRSGVEEFETAVVPSWPYVLSPQHSSAPFVVMTHTFLLPIATVATPTHCPLTHGSPHADGALHVPAELQT